MKNTTPFHDLENEMLKACTLCQQKKPLSGFQFKNKTTGQLYSRCSSCSNQGRRVKNSENRRNVIKPKFKDEVYGDLNANITKAFGDAFGKAIAFLIQEGKLK